MQLSHELYQQLCAAVEQTLLASESVHDALSNITAAGFDIRLDVWAEGTPSLSEILSDEDGHLDLFDHETHSHDPVALDWLKTDEDVDLLRCMGIHPDLT